MNLYNTLQPVHCVRQCRVRTVWGVSALRTVRFFVLGYHQTIHVGPSVKRLWAVVESLEAIVIGLLLRLLTATRGPKRVLANTTQLLRQPGIGWNAAR